MEIYAGKADFERTVLRRHALLGTGTLSGIQ